MTTEHGNWTPVYHEWPSESSPEYQDGLGTSWAPSFTRVGRGRDVAIKAIYLMVALLIGGLVLSAVLP